jgi:hypothetical protein
VGKKEEVKKVEESHPKKTLKKKSRSDKKKDWTWKKGIDTFEAAQKAKEAADRRDIKRLEETWFKPQKEEIEERCRQWHNREWPQHQFCHPNW